MNKISQSRFLTVKQSEEQTLFEIDHPEFTAVISEFGGQLLKFKAKNSEPLIWLSNSAKLDGSKPIRGGAPLCWPWFGPAPSQFSGEPQHGYARNVKWQIDQIIEDEQSVELVMTPLFDQDLKEKLSLDLQVRYHLANAARIELITNNTGSKPFELTAAIHTYLSITDVANLAIDQLLNCDYFDKLTDQKRNQSTAFALNEAMDRVYDYEKAELIVRETNREITVTNGGHDSVVVWNPWQQTAKQMADFDDLGFEHMLCIEAAITKGITLQPGQSHRLEQTIC